MKRTPKAWQYKPREVYQIRLARWFAGLKGFSIDGGSWIHAPSGKPVAQGWAAFYAKYRKAILALIWGEEVEEVEGGEVGRRILEKLTAGGFHTDRGRAR